MAKIEKANWLYSPGQQLTDGGEAWGVAVESSKDAPELKADDLVKVVHAISTYYSNGDVGTVVGFDAWGTLAVWFPGMLPGDSLCVWPCEVELYQEG